MNIAEKIAAEINGIGGALGGRLVAVNVETGEVGGETFDLGARPPLEHPLISAWIDSINESERELEELAPRGTWAE
jgi:hypothetical protein